MNPAEFQEYREKHLCLEQGVEKLEGLEMSLDILIGISAFLFWELLADKWHDMTYVLKEQLWPLFGL